MNKILFFVLCLFLAPSVFAAGLLQSAVQNYPEWKRTKDAFTKDCANDAVELQKKAQPGTMLNSQQKNLKSLHVPTVRLNNAGVAASILSKFEAIDKAAKAKAIPVLKKSKKHGMFTDEMLQRMTGLAAAMEADLVPEDYLRSFDYKTSCECRNSAANIAADEAAYNKISAAEFMNLEEQNKLVCFAKSASL